MDNRPRQGQDGPAMDGQDMSGAALAKPHAPGTFQRAAMRPRRRRHQESSLPETAKASSRTADTLQESQKRFGTVFPAPTVRPLDHLPKLVEMHCPHRLAPPGQEGTDKA